MHCEFKKKILKYFMLNYSCSPINYTSHRTSLINGIRTKNILDNFTFTITSDLKMYFFKDHCTYNKHPPYVRCMRRYSIGRQTDGLTCVAISSSQRRLSFLSIFIFTEDNVTKTTYHYSP